MTPVVLHDRDVLAATLARDPELNLYLIGDLDDFFWPYTIWYGDGAGNVVLVYAGGSLPVVVALSRHDLPGMRALVAAVAPLLPPRCYAHLSPGLVGALAATHGHEPRGPHRRMILAAPERLPAPSEVAVLGPGDRVEIEALYAAAYPKNWFDARMLETGRYIGVRADGALAAIAGVHVYSPGRGVAALGNVTTAPAHRGRGLATRATAALCHLLRRDCDTIGLNVAADNAEARALYTKLGFAVVAEYEEHLLTAVEYSGP
jgi:ribosomal protein S18 acetylase RimI-like enzyme